MKICMVSSESVPFSKSGGLADVVGAPTALAALGDDIRVILPSMAASRPLRSKLDITVPSPCSAREETFRQATLDKVVYYFVDHCSTPSGGIYGDTSHAPYDDNLVRTLLNKAAMALVKR